MRRRDKEATMRRWATSIVTLLAMAVFLVPMTQAAEEIAGRNVQHTQKVEMIEVGDVPGHFMGVSQAVGMTFYTKGSDAGEITSKKTTSIIDVVKGKGSFTGYDVKPFKDGSMIFIKSIGTMTSIDGGKKTAFEGTWEVTGGTGRYAGAKGGGTWKGERIGDIKTGGDSYSDFIGTITK